MTEVLITVLYMAAALLIAVSPICDRILANQSQTAALRARVRPK